MEARGLVFQFAFAGLHPEQMRARLFKTLVVGPAASIRREPMEKRCHNNRRAIGDGSTKIKIVRRNLDSFGISAILSDLPRVMSTLQARHKFRV